MALKAHNLALRGRIGLPGPGRSMGLACLLACRLLGGWTSTGFADSLTTVSEPGPADCADLLERVRAQFQLPALAAVVVRGDRVVALGAVGVRRLGSDIRVTPQDKFHIGSITKSMTATLAARLVERGTIRWNATLEDVFPDRAARFDPAFRQVTLEQLLAHRGGVPASLDADGLWASLWERSEPPREQRLYLLERVTARAPAVPPGSKALYSNAGYALAGAMLERAASQTWEDLIRAELFEPLRMSSAGFGAPAAPGQLDQPWGHASRDQTFRPVPPGPRADNPPAIAPAGAVHCSLPDLARYLRFHLRGAQGKEAGLTRASFEKLHAPVGEAEYALGWVVVSRDWAGGRALTHAGSNTTFFAVVWLAPARDFALAVATNAGGAKAEEACDRAAWLLIQQWLLKEASSAPP
jgi:CubicO group peptidase (beta-lactamase class C family)